VGEEYDPHLGVLPVLFAYDVPHLVGFVVAGPEMAEGLQPRLVAVLLDVLEDEIAALDMGFGSGRARTQIALGD
jgi:hypothetical protein